MKKYILFICVIALIFALSGCSTVDKKEAAKAKLVGQLTEQWTESILENTGYYTLMSIITDLNNLEKLKEDNKITEKEYKAYQQKLLKKLDEFSKDKEKK